MIFLRKFNFIKHKEKQAQVFYASNCGSFCYILRAKCTAQTVRGSLSTFVRSLTKNIFFIKKVRTSTFQIIKCGVTSDKLVKICFVEGVGLRLLPCKNVFGAAHVKCDAKMHFCCNRAEQTMAAKMHFCCNRAKHACLHE